MHIKKIFIVLGVSICAYGLSYCNPAKQEEKAETKEAPQMYQQSELAALMHEVHDLSAEWKQQLESGEPLTPVPDWVSQILSADATSPDELANGAFEPLAHEYLRQLEEMAKAEGDDRLKAYNTSIQTCISCHKIYCNGPIPKIKKLEI
ncbi:MAG: hypothetical protein JJU02_00430 [Cryomorphaceae bacterium]|nr:hypothetical protein [Cryomorphaceae bacterium]